jgi:hypothetical protein
MSAADYVDEVRRLSTLIDNGVKEAAKQARAYAEKERDYRHAKADAWTRTVGIIDPETGKGLLAEHRRAIVDADTADLRYERDLAEGLRQVATEALRARRAQISAVQTLVNGERAEAEFARTGP